MYNFRVKIVVIVFLYSTFSHSADFSKCFKQSGMKYRISPLLLQAIAKTESGFDPAAVNDRNRNGSRDIGIMQVNSWWLDRIAEYGIDDQALRDPCVNIDVGAWILANNILRYGNSWTAVGVYNTGRVTKTNEVVRAVYIKRVKANLLLLSDK